VLTANGMFATRTTSAAVPIGTERTLCAEALGGIYSVPSSEPLARCQWDMTLINADTERRARATGAGVRVGVIDSGIDLTHPDIAPNLDIEDSCSFVSTDERCRGARWRLPCGEPHRSRRCPRRGASK
jgi:hypothetical protein